MYDKIDPTSVLSTRELISELMAERRKDRRAGILKTLFLTLGGVVYFGWMFFLFGGFNQVQGPTKDYAAVVKISGMISADKEASYANLAPVLKQAFEDPNAKGVILLINSPGGTPVQAGLIHDLIVKLKTESKKPVVAVGEDMVTSGAYLIAGAADRIVVNKSSVTGSIGVISAGFGFNGLMDKLGVERRVATAGDSKNMLDPFSPANQKDLEKQRALLSSIHTQFKQYVTEDRGSRLKMDTPGLFEGNVWTGEEAVAIGLVDEIGNIEDTAQKQLNTTEFKYYEQRKPFVDNFMRNLGVQASQFLSVTTAQPPQVMYRE